MIKTLTTYLSLLSIHYISAVCGSPSTGIFSIQVSSNERVEILDYSWNYVKQAVVCDFDWGWTTIDYASWIWNSTKANVDETMDFRINFPIYGKPVSGTLTVAADDVVKVYYKNEYIDCNDSTYDQVQICDVLNFLVEGDNIFIFNVHNWEGPGGLVFRFDIEASY